MSPQQTPEQQHEKASQDRISRLQDALNARPQGTSLANLNRELDAQLKIEDFIVKSREANHPKLKAWGSIVLSGAGIIISLAVGYASLVSAPHQAEQTRTLEERKANAEIVLKAVGNTPEETRANISALAEVGLLNLEQGQIEKAESAKALEMTPHWQDQAL